VQKEKKREETKYKKALTVVIQIVISKLTPN